jgi:hypothetical protein
MLSRWYVTASTHICNPNNMLMLLKGTILRVTYHNINILPITPVLMTKSMEDS